MIRERSCALTPSRVFVNAAGLALALLGTLLIATAVEAPAGVAVLALVLSLASPSVAGAR